MGTAVCCGAMLAMSFIPVLARGAEVLNMTTSPPPMHTHSSAANASTTPGVFSVGRANNSHGLTSGMLSFSEQVNTMSQGNLRGSAADYRSHSYHPVTPPHYKYPESNCWTGQGAVDIDSAEMWNAPRKNSAGDCIRWCSSTSSCDCVVYHPDGGQCFRRKSCDPSRFYHQEGFTVYVMR